MKERLDRMLMQKGLVSSRERAKALIMEGHVLVNNIPVTKAGALIRDEDMISLKGTESPYVSRGGIKLEAALKHFGIDVNGSTAMDVGASTGGFTDCMLKMGAKRVYSIDVGYGQFDWQLRHDPRVILLERTNIRYLERQGIPEGIDIAAVDVSFISLTKVIPKITEFLKPEGVIIALLKPQFEVGKGEVGKGGIVREEEKRLLALESVSHELERAGIEAQGVMQSPIKGQKGNIEYLLYLRKRH